MGTATKSRTLSGKAAAQKQKAERKPKASPKAAAVEQDALAAIERPERSSPCMAEVDDAVLEFIAAIDRFKLEHGRPFPSWSEILLIVRQLGYSRG